MSSKEIAADFDSLVPGLPFSRRSFMSPHWAPASPWPCSR